MSILSTAELQRDLAAIGAALREITVVVRTGRGRRTRTPGGQGSGVIWTADGVIVTNAHVATDDRVGIELPDGRSAAAHLVARDPRRDLAVLRIEPPGGPLTAARLGDPERLRPGELIVALGHPLGVAHSLSLGVVHTTGRASWQGDSITAPALIHTDIRLAPGNSGGPLADVGGRVVGINAMIAGGLGVAVSVDEVRRYLIAGAPRPRLGATLRPVAVRMAEPASVAAGLLVLETTSGGAAARAGVLPGDVLLGHAGRPFRTPDDLLALLHDAGPGGTVRLDVGRAGHRTSVAIVLGPAVDVDRRAA
jgi:serine protease Do